jgi:beta-mannosidase
MLGLDPELARGPLYGELLPGVLADAGLDAAYVPSTPWGGDVPFRTDQGVANYYGVGAYLRPLEDVRRADVKFAPECLAFANVPDEDALEGIDAPEGLTPIHPRWKAGVPRDAGAGWDFDDVRDHYLRLLFGVDPVDLRSIDPDRYLELSRIVSGEVMAEVFGEWRRAASGCRGGLVLWLTDLALGAGWGVLDVRGEPKVAYHHLRRALAPVAVWTTDEGLGGIAIHVANDTNEPFEGELRLALYRDLEVAVAEERMRMDLESHGVFTDNVERVLGRFVDAARAYRFGPPAQDLIVVSLEQSGGQNAGNGSQCFRLPAGRPTAQESAQRLGVSATLRRDSEEHATVRLSSRRFLYGARITVPGYRALDDALSVEPGHGREVRLRALPGAEGGRGTLTALNLSGRVAIAEDEE